MIHPTTKDNFINMKYFQFIQKLGHNWKECLYKFFIWGVCKQHRLYIFLLFIFSTLAIFSLFHKTSNEAKRLNYPSECFCGEENFCLPLDTNLFTKVQQKFFNCSLKSYLEDFRLLNTYKMPDLNYLNLSLNIDFVTATSANHFKLSRGLIKDLRRVHPQSRIVYYDLGLNEEQIAEVKTWCNIKYRKFDVHKYPKHVSNLLNFSWKLLLIAEQFKEQKPFIYVDSSIRFNETYNLSQIYSAIREQKIEPYSALQHTFHSIYATTAPGFYDYVPLPNEISQNYREDEASIELVVPVDYTREVLKWNILCALTPDCIAPEGHRKHCSFVNDDFYKTYHNCHRYDQSLFCSITARMLFGPENYASKVGYTNLSVVQNTNDIKEVIKRRIDNYLPINQMTETARDNFINEKLVLEC